MNTECLTERATVPKNKRNLPPTVDDDDERVEFKAPPGFTAKVDAAAKSLGLSRSAFCRMAILEKIQRQKRDQDE